MARTRVEVKPCEICGGRAILPYDNHMLCPSCSLFGCGRCWKAIPRLERPWFWLGLFQRLRCPNCGAKGRLQW